MGEDRRLTVQGVQRVESAGDEDADSSQQQRRANDPERSPQIAPVEPQGFEVRPSERHDRNDEGAGNQVEDPLQGVRGPDHDENRRVSKHNLYQVAPSL